MEDKLDCAEDGDRLINVEIPGQTTDPLVYDTITRFMIHGPCAPCFIDQKCSKCDPKRFYNQAAFDVHGFT